MVTKDSTTPSPKRIAYKVVISDQFQCPWALASMFATIVNMTMIEQVVQTFMTCTI